MRNIILLSLILSSCNPVKRVLNHHDKRSEIITILKSQGICKPDTLTFFKTDTIIKVDTVGVIEIFTDTFIINDTMRIISYKYRDIIKTITVRDTIKSIVIDSDRVNALSQINSKIVTENNLLKAQKRNYGYISLTLFAFLLLLLVLIIKK